MELLDQERHSGGRLCPCGADLEPGFAYCCDDCVPPHIAADTGAPKDPWADVMPTR